MLSETSYRQQVTDNGVVRTWTVFMGWQYFATMFSSFASLLFTL
jgi:hypothetical protein